MTTTDFDIKTSHPTPLSAGRSRSALFAVVGFDGSRPSVTALKVATEMIRGRNGHIEVVYVAHFPAIVAMSAPAIVGMRKSFDLIAEELDATARAELDDREPRWHFQRRNGRVAEQLIAAASELRRQHGPEATVVTVVGAPAHLVHHLAGSVPAALAHNARFPMLIATADSPQSSPRRSGRPSGL